jgi:hypothetical protein
MALWGALSGSSGSDPEVVAPALHSEAEGMAGDAAASTRAPVVRRAAGRGVVRGPERGARPDAPAASILCEVLAGPALPAESGVLEVVMVSALYRRTEAPV